MLKEVIEFRGIIRVTRTFVPDDEDEDPDPRELEQLGQLRLPQLKIIDVEENNE